MESDGIIFQILSLNKRKRFTLTIGALEDEKVLFQYICLWNKFVTFLS